jgi:hypothetical protein
VANFYSNRDLLSIKNGCQGDIQIMNLSGFDYWILFLYLSVGAFVVSWYNLQEEIHERPYYSEKRAIRILQRTGIIVCWPIIGLTIFVINAIKVIFDIISDSVRGFIK